MIPADVQDALIAYRDAWAVSRRRDTSPRNEALAYQRMDAARTKLDEAIRAWASEPSGVELGDEDIEVVETTMRKAVG